MFSSYDGEYYGNKINFDIFFIFVESTFNLRLVSLKIFKCHHRNNKYNTNDYDLQSFMNIFKVYFEFKQTPYPLSDWCNNFMNEQEHPETATTVCCC